MPSAIGRLLWPEPSLALSKLVKVFRVVGQSMIGLRRARSEGFQPFWAKLKPKRPLMQR